MTPPTRHDAETLLEHAGWIRSLARRLVGGDADDLVQETLLVALERPPAADRALRPWLARVAKNLAANVQRGRRHRRDREARVACDAESAAPLPSPDELVARSEQQREVVDAVLGLDEPYRSTLLLRYFEGLEPVEIARRQGIPDATVRTRLARGVDRVRSRLDDRNSGDRSRWVQALVPLAGLPGAPLVPLDAPAPDPTAPLPAASASSVLKSVLTALATMPSLFKITLACIPLLAALFWFAQDPVSSSSPRLAAASPVAEASAPRDHLAPIGPDAQVLARSPSVTGAGDPAAAREVPEAMLSIVDRHTGRPVWGMRFRGPRAEDDNPRVTPRPTEEDDVLLSVDDGRVAVPRGLEGIVPLHAFESTNAFMRAFRPNVGAALPDPTRIEWDGDQGVARVDVGPTILLDLSLPDEVAASDLFAILSDRAYADSWGTRVSTVRTLDDRTFVRFSRESVEQTRDVWLHFVTADGRHGATVRMDGRGGELSPVPVAITDRSVLSGSIQANDGSSLPQLEIFLFPGVVRAADVLQPWRVSVPRLSIALDGDTKRRTFEYAAIPPGTYTLCAHARGFAPFWNTLEVTAGARTHPIELERVDPTNGVIEGQVTSRSGRYDERLKVIAIDPTPWLPSDDLLADVEWLTVDGRRVGMFRIEGVVDRLHQIRVLGVDERGNMHGIQRLLPAESLSARPGDPIEIELADGVQEWTLRVHATDRASGEPIESFHAYLWSRADGYEVDADGFEGEAVIRGVRDVEGLELAVVSDAHRGLIIDAETLDGRTSIDVELVRGWSARIGVRGPDRSPGPRCEVLLDGVRAGTTDEEGLLMVHADAAPTRVEVRAAGWRLESSNCLDDEGKLRGRFEASGRVLRFEMVAAD